jgi:phosphatidylserine decarboxylase
MIKFYNRKTNTYEEEKVAGGKYITWCYESPIGKSLTELLIKKKLVSKVYGKYCDTKLSKRKIQSFVDNFDIDMNISTKKLEEFSSFNDFFIRQLNRESRPFSSDKNSLISPGDGRLLAYNNISMRKLIQVKDITYSLSELLGDNKIANEYEGGVCVVLRLCPTDYHRFHFVDSGVPASSNFIDGSYYSVNPTALERIPKLYCQNKREWSLFKSDNFGDIIHVEVGATCVGTIIQTYTPGEKVEKGKEKGYFKFGGSTTILFFKKDTISISEDILVQSSLGFECKVLMGETIGSKK